MLGIGSLTPLSVIFCIQFYHAPLEPLAFTNRSLKRQLVGFVAYVFVLAERSCASH